jgi:hypothetical protein
MTDTQTRRTPQPEPAQPPAGTPVIVDVIALTRPDGTVGFSQSWRWQNGAPGGKDSIVIPPRKSEEPGTPMHFHLRDKTEPRLHLEFTDAAEGAMWVKRDACPGGDQPCEDPQIPACSIQRRRELLIVHNENSEACTLHYMLRFKDRGGIEYEYDPDITNGGTNDA